MKSLAFICVFLHFRAKKNPVVHGNANCTRIVARLLKDDYTWESIPCDKRAADFTICEYRYETRNMTGLLFYTITSFHHEIYEKIALQNNILDKTTTRYWNNSLKQYKTK